MEERNPDLNRTLENLNTASIEDINFLLNHFNGEPYMVDGMMHTPFNEPRVAAQLNARYHELTGQDHPVFLEQQPKVIESLMQDKDMLLKAGAYTPFYFETLEKLYENVKSDNVGMDIINDPNHPFRKVSSPYFDFEKVSSEDISKIFDVYKVQDELDFGELHLKPVLVDGITHHGTYNPQFAAQLNARYHELTGQDHPGYLSEQAKALDLILDNKEQLLKDGRYLDTQIDTFNRMRNSLGSSEPTLEISSLSPEKHVLGRMSSIIRDLDKSNVQDVESLLNYFNGKPVIIQGMSYHPFNDPKLAARLNARYHELTGQDHPVFMEQAPKVIDDLMKDKNKLLRAGVYTPMYFDQLQQIKDGINGKGPGMEIAEGNHPLLDDSVFRDLGNATAEQIKAQLDYYNGKPVLINGVAYHPFNDPKLAAQLNTRYHELTGQNHPVYMEQAPKVISDLMKDKEMLMGAGAYDESYFSELSSIQTSISNSLVSEKIQSAKSKEDLVKIKEELSQNRSSEYQSYRASLSQAYLAEKDDKTFISSEFTVRDGEVPKCEHKLESIRENERTLLQQHTFDYDEKFKQEMLEPAIVDYAQSSPVMSSDVRTNESLSANYRAISENNNVLSVNNVQPEYANTISSAVQQIEPTVYQQQVEQQLAQQQQLSGPVRTLSIDSGLSRGGFINVLVLTGIIGFVSGFIVWITLTIMGR